MHAIYVLHGQPDGAPLRLSNPILTLILTLTLTLTLTLIP